MPLINFFILLLHYLSIPFEYCRLAYAINAAIKFDYSPITMEIIILAIPLFLKRHSKIGRKSKEKNGQV